MAGFSISPAPFFQLHLKHYICKCLPWEHLVRAADNDPHLDSTLQFYPGEGYDVYYSVRGYGWRRSKLSGPFVITNEDGVKFMEGEYVNGMWQGPVLTFYKGQRVATLEHYAEGQLNGNAMVWNENGQRIREVFYSRGRKDGVETYWNVDGQIAKKSTWSHGKILELHIFNKGVVTRSYDENEAMEYLTGIVKDRLWQGHNLREPQRDKGSGPHFMSDDKPDKKASP